MIVVSIIVILSSILIGYSSQSSKQLLLTSTEAKLLSLISRAKFLSIETFFTEDDPEICAYGVTVDQAAGEIFIFQDRDPECPADDRYNEDDDLRLTGELNEITLDLNVMRIGDDTSLEDIVFIPPDPDVEINDGQTEASIVVELVDGSGDFTVTVNEAGQVKAE
ncbi:MAG: hypothetical protein HYS89_00130 [Candidatus Colwellbacteria bacterium]|nr:hypothetical protein [Candidatus Colwellbacteria bacterium]